LGLPVNILIFSEEYRKVTKGMFRVWVAQAGEASKKHQVHILLNHEHWAFDEVQEKFCSNNQILVHRLPFDMPEKIFRRCLGLDYFPEKLKPLKLVGAVLNSFFLPLIIFYMVLRVKQIRPDALFSHNGGWPAGRLCRWMIFAALLARVPSRIFIVHNFPYLGSSYMSIIYFLRSIVWAWLIDKCATSIVTVSDSVKAELGKVFRQPVFRIYNGLDLSSEDCSDSSSLSWSSSGSAVGFAGALTPLKGPHFLLDSFKFVEFPCELALLGPSSQDYLKSLEQKAKLCANKVTFLGFHHDVDSFIKKINFLVVPSIAFESFGMVILEAMKHSKAVICTDHGGMKEIVEDGVTGLVVPSNDELALARAITKLLVNPDMASRMGKAGNQRLNRLFTSDIMTSHYDSLIT
jgi:teichuronic acid biosynthesis glycosyltransferase TuaC